MRSNVKQSVFKHRIRIDECDDMSKLVVLSEASISQNAIPYAIDFTKDYMFDIDDLVNGPISEGIDVIVKKDADGKMKKEVSWNANHDKGVSAKDIVTMKLSVPKVEFQNGKIQVYSILKRTSLEKQKSDGNPLVYAFKSERGFAFKSQEDQVKITELVDKLLEKFFKDFKLKVHNEEVTAVMLPSGNALNSKFAKHMQDVAKRVGMKLTLNDNALVKLSVDDFINDVYEDVNSDFCQWLYSHDDAIAERYEALLDKYLENMRKNHKGLFSYHFIENTDLRNHIGKSMKIGSDYVSADYYKHINGSHVLLLDDTISRGASLSEAATEICNNFLPKTVTALTLFSTLNN